MFCPTWCTVLKMFAKIIPDWESEGNKKKFSRSCLWARKRRNRDEKVFLRTSKYIINCNKSLNSLSVKKQVCNFPYFAFCSFYKTNRFHFVLCLFSYRSQKMSKCGKNISDTLACGLYATFLFLYHILTSPVICYNWTDAQQNGIYLLYIYI